MLTWMRWNWILIILPNMSSVLAQGCISPPNTIIGTYFINGATVVVGANVNPYSTLTYECEDMYTKSGSQSLYCGANGTWIGTMKCSKKCELPYSLTLDFTCSLGNNYINCDKVMEHGSIVKPKCKPLHKLSKNQIMKGVTCNNGRWSNTFRECVTDCGKERGIAVPLRELSPWHVGVYQLKNQVYEQVCGGTIVSRKFVVSAAHCFLQTPYEDFYAVAAGKLYRAWDHKEKDDFPYIQRKMIEKVQIPNTYFGFDNNLEDDIAVVVVKTPFDFYPQVHAACLDVNDVDLKTYISYNNEGKVVGWGVTKEGDILSSSNVLMKADIQIINRNDCINKVPREFTKFVSATKFCVKGVRNMTICNGDSGGGILVRVPDKGIPRWYLMGVVSVGILDAQRTTCQTNTYTAVTSVQSHADFIVNELQSSDCSLLDGTPGVCKYLSECKKAQEQLNKNGINPTICSSSGSQSVVCCPNDDPIKNTTPAKSAVSLTHKECDFPKDAITVSRTGQKAWDKCIDLAESVFPCVSLDPSSNALKIRMDTCQHTGVELIIGGTATTPNEFPHQAQLGYDNETKNGIEWNLCGGTLISEQWVMTTAHCHFSRNSREYVKYVWLAHEDLDKYPEYLFNVVERVIHPEYRAPSIYNDIGLLKLDKKVKYSEKIRPACLHVGNQINDQKAIATGWGITDNKFGNKSDALLKVTLDKFSYEECSQVYRPERKSINGIRNDTQICYGGKTEAKDTCQGDAGGPLQIYNYGVHCTYTVIGITSVGRSCGIVNMPAVYTRVSAFVPWIESVVWPNSDETVVIKDKISSTEDFVWPD
ncbi:transmembrane protease serine 9-like [Arctopsyche grandis]|uniref:transmembrane protease serine 9-like n=1 Tax=Arctopsyche grandis TaxID=121162 RepID=UPI00406DA1F0